MAIYREDIVDIELTSGNIYRSFMKTTIGEGDKLANRFGIRALRNGVEESLGGSCTGYFIRNAGDTVAIEGTVSGAVAYVDLPQACYAYEGQFTLAIKVTSGGATGTMRIVDGVVSNTTTGSVIDPGTIVPSIDDLIDAIEAAVASIPADYSEMWETFAPPFSNETAYSYGQYVTYDGGLWRFIEDHPAGSWNGNHALTVTAGGEFMNGNNAADMLTGAMPIRLVPGKYIALNGSSVTMSDGVPAISGNSSAGYAVGVMACAEGDVFFINGHGGTSTRLWGFISDSGEVLEVESASATRNNLMVTAPADAAWIIIHTNDRRVSYKGFNYASQWQHNTVDILDYYQRSSGTSAGVTYTWTGKVCVVDGTSTGNSFNFFTTYNDPTIPMIVEGGKYFIKFKQGGGGNVALALVWHFTNSTVKREYYYEDTEITAPTGFDGVSIALYVRKGTEADEETVEVNLFTMAGGVGAVDARLTNLEESLEAFLPRNVLKEFGVFNSETVRMVEYTWNSDHETCVVNGTATGGVSYNFIWSYNDGLPEEIVPGQQYQLKLDASTEDKVGVRFYFAYVDKDPTNVTYYRDTMVTIPDDCIGITIRLNVSENTVCDNVTVNVKLMSTSATDIESGVANHEAKMYSIGSSFMTGLIYTHDDDTGTAKFRHRCAYDDSPYGNVAIGLGIEQKNVQHILLPSTGLLYDAGSGSILSKLLETDLSGYDYVLTQFNRPDMGVGQNTGYEVGDLTSTAGDGSIAGAVLQLLAYMKTQNPNATLILVGAPPSDQNYDPTQISVFDVVYNNGASIHEADLMMHRLAVREHFIFIDWEDLNLSYYYYSLCDDNNLHPRDDKTCRSMGLYLARQCNYTTSQVKVLGAEE